jgi:chromate reductase, NAD(P)H dehydrogenase (quinone)
MITILSGSPRKNSTTLKVAKGIKNVIKENYLNEVVKVIDFNGFDIPSMNIKNISADDLSPWQQDLYDAMSESDLIFVLTPEYNWFPSAEIIQMIHTTTSSQFKTMWDNKVFATCGVSNGRGGRMPAVQLSYTINKIISVFNYDSFVVSKMFESQFSDKALDHDGNSLGNEEYMKGLKAFIDSGIKMSRRWNQGDRG